DPGILSKRIHIVREKLNGYIYAENSKNIEEIVGEKLKQKKYTISIAESCTGGLLGNLITDVSGSSEYFLGGVVTYSNEAKIKFLMVPKEILKMYGAVSKECAYYMAKGGKEIFDSDISIAITGIAGPTGGTPEKPVGLVFIGINYLDKIYVVGNQFSGERKEIKMKSALKALYLLNSILDGVDFSENLVKL
ncbi:MAG: CinA family protein, partial [candidate division WOR-3 bacterium]